MNLTVRFLKIFSFACLALILPSAGHAAGLNRDPKPHLDGADAAGSPLDLRSVSFGQRGTELFLKLQTAGEWTPKDVSQGAPGALCVKLYYGSLPNPRSQICVFDRGADKPGLAYARLDPFGGTVYNRIVPASLYRADKRSLEAEFTPSSINLNQGRYSWQAVSTWACGQPAACSDLVPSFGNVIARLRPLAEPRCFGAASRNPRYRCVNPILRRAVVPAPEEAVLSPNARCTVVSTSLPYTCQFGVRYQIAERSVALIGDSHAAHWRGALEVVAQARRWRGLSITRAGCPLSTASPAFDRARRASCARWRTAVLRWLRAHPKVRTVFVSQIAGADVRAPRGTSEREYQIRGFMRAWNRLPRTVRQIIVLRDTPATTETASLCVQQAVVDGRPPDNSCSVSRSRAVKTDPAVIAARRTRSKRVHVIDLTPLMCSTKRCFPVIGGVLVHKDTTHLTPLFATTLGPFLLDKIRRLYR